MKNSLYREVARKSEGYKILDNSIIETGEAFDIEEVLKAAEIIGANEVILPDVYMDGPATLNAVRDSLEYINIHPEWRDRYNWMAVAQGRNETEWVECFKTLESIRDIDVIGIPKCLTKMHPSGRPHFEPYWLDTCKKIHLLGLWYGFYELEEYIYPDDIRSVDTCMEAYIQKYGTKVRPDGFTIDLEED